MREAERVDRDDLAGLAAIRLDARVERPPLPVHPVPRRLRGVVDLLGVVVEDVGPGVREGPRDVAIEADHDAGQPGDRHAVRIEPSGHDEMRLVPDGRQRQLEMRIARQQRVAGRRAGGGHRPVVAREMRTLLRLDRAVAPWEEGVVRGDQTCGVAVGRTGRRESDGVDARRGLPVGLDRLDDRRVRGNERGGGRPSDERGDARRGRPRARRTRACTPCG